VGVLILYGYAIRPNENAQSIAIFNDTLYMASGYEGLRVINLSDINEPQDIRLIKTNDDANHLELNNNILYVSNGRSGVKIFNIDEPTNPLEISNYDTPGYVFATAQSGNHLYIADGNSGVRIMRVENKESQNLREIKAINISGTTRHLAFHENKLYVATNDRLTIYDVSNKNDPLELGVYRANATVHKILLDGNLAFLAADSRGVIVVDVSDPAEIKEISELNTNGTARDVFRSGIYVYVANGDRGISIIDVSHIDALREVGNRSVTGNAQSIVIKDDYTFVAAGDRGLQILHSEINFEINEVGFSSSQMTTEKVAVDGSYAYLAAGPRGMRILDISNPSNPTEINFTDTPGYAMGITVEGDLAYVSDRGEGLRIFDISDPNGDLSLVSNLPGGRDAYATDIEGDFIYLADGKAGLRIYNKTDPSQPVETGHADTPGNAMGVTVSGEYAYVADGESGIRLINIIDPQIPTELGFYDTPGDAHAVAIVSTVVSNSGQDDSTITTSGVRLFAFVADGSGGLRVLDVSDPRAPSEIGFNETPIFVQDINIVGTYAYLAGREEGLLIYDISDPTQPTQVGRYDTPGAAYGVSVIGKYAYLADFVRGLRVIDISAPNAPSEVGFYDAPTTVKDLTLIEPYAYVADGEQGMWVYNVEDINAIREIGYYATPGNAISVASVGNQVYVSDGGAGVQIMDASNPNAVNYSGSFDTIGFATGTYVVDQTMYVADGSAGLQIFEISVPSDVKRLGSEDTLGDARGVYVAGKYAYIADGPGGLYIANITNSNDPTKAGVFNGVQDARRVTLYNQYALLASGVNGLLIIDVSHPLTPVRVAALDTDGAAEDVYVQDIYAFLADGRGGIKIIDMTNPQAPKLVGSALTPADALAIEALSMPPTNDTQPGVYQIFVANDDHGLRVYEAEKTVLVVEVSSLETPLSFTALQALIDILLFGIGGLFLWLAFFAQYTLPVSGLKERWASISRIVNFLSGSHGPAVHVRNGQLIQRKEEEKRRGPGVVLVDLSSAIVLERRLMPSPVSGGFGRVGRIIQRIFPSKSKPTTAKVKEPKARIMGPGLIFTGGKNPANGHRYDERIRGVADLRPQVRAETDILAYTRDGIEVRSTVFAVFTLGQRPEVLKVTYQGEEKAENLRVIYVEEKRTPPTVDYPLEQKEEIVRDLVDELDEDDKGDIHRYIESQRGTIITTGSPAVDEDQGAGEQFNFDEKRVFSAITSTAQDIDKDKDLEWTELPAKVATEVFRNRLAREVYDYLYQPGVQDEYPLQGLKTDFARRVRNLGVLAYRFIERSDGELIAKGQTWDENQLLYYPEQELRQPKVLRVRGIKIITAGFTELKPVNRLIYQQRLDNWRARWERDAVYSRVHYDLEAMRVLNQARVQGQRDLAITLAKIFQTSEHAQEALALRVFQALESAATNPATRQLLPDATVNLIARISDLLLEEGQEETTG
jgi:hypothetical protein